MEKQELKKNILDLMYNHESSKANAFLVFITTGLLVFLGNFILLKSYIFIIGLFITIFTVILSILFYVRSSRRMRYILRGIEAIQ